MNARRGMHGLVVDTVGQRIVSGGITPGTAIDLIALEQELGASRSVVREAVRVLADKGLVDARPKRGTVVRGRAEWSLLDPDLLRWQFDRPDGSFLDNLAEVRGIIEPSAARIAAQRRTDDDLDVMRSALDEMTDQDADADSIVAADLVFHRALLAATHNDLLQRLELVIAAALRARDELVHHSHGTESSAPAHRDVLAAIEAQDPEDAEASMRRLLTLATRDEAAVLDREQAKEPLG